MPINSKEISNEIEAMEKENASEKPNRKNRKELWKTQSLKDSLYNDDGKGNKIPRDSDIDQGSPRNLKYIIKYYELGNCFLLTDLMGLVRKNPKFITEKLITVKKDNEVKVILYETKKPIFKFKGNTIEVENIPDSKKSYSVTKDEALKWKTSHKALWPVVIEIAYAKHIKELTKKNTNSSDDVDLLQDLRYLARQGGTSALALAQLTGKTSRKVYYQNYDINQLQNFKKYKGIDEKTKKQIKSFKGNDTSDIKKFPNKYSDYALKIYNKIQKKLKKNKIITVAFKDKTPYTDNSTISLMVINLANEVQKNGKYTLYGLNNIFKEKDYEKWLNEHNLTLDKLEGQPYEICKQFVLDTADLTELPKISKTKIGIEADHGYLVLDTLEHEGYKYIVLKNPHQMTTAINYKKSSKLPPEVKLPEQIDKVKNECMMELNHFYKKLASIDYDK